MFSYKQNNSFVNLILITYGLSLLMPVFYTKAVGAQWDGQVSDGSTWYGIEILLIGWFPVLGSPDKPDYFSIAWFANPLFCLSMIFIFTRNLCGILTAALGLAIGLTSFSYKKIWNDKEPPTIIITDYGVGLYVWLFALGLMVVAALNLLYLRFLTPNIPSNGT